MEWAHRVPNLFCRRPYHTGICLIAIYKWKKIFARRFETIVSVIHQTIPPSMRVVAPMSLHINRFQFFLQAIQNEWLTHRLFVASHLLVLANRQDELQSKVPVQWQPTRDLLMAALNEQPFLPTGLWLWQWKIGLTLHEQILSHPTQTLQIVLDSLAILSEPVHPGQWTAKQKPTVQSIFCRLPDLRPADP